MSRRKRVRSVKELTNTLISQGKAQESTFLAPNYSGDLEHSFQDEYLQHVPPTLIQPLGRKPGRNLSMVEEGMLISVQQAFDDGVLNILSDRERQCFTEVIISGDTYGIVAARNRITQGAVQTYVKRAAKKIRNYIGARDGE